MNITKSLAVLGIAGALAGCATSSGNHSMADGTKYLKITLNQSNKVDVYDAFGQPAMVKTNSVNSHWTYVAAKEQMHASTFIPFVGMVTGGNVINLTATTFVFNLEHILIDTASETHNEYVNMWEGMALGVGSVGEKELTSQVKAVPVEMDSLGLVYVRSKTDEKAVGWLYFARNSI